MNFDVVKKTEEVNDALKDLERWEADIKKADLELKKQRLKDHAKIPPVRSPNKSDSNTEKENPQKEMSTTKEIRKLKPEHPGKNSNSEKQQENDRRRQKAILEKEKGNALFSKGKYREAITAYSEAMKDDPTNAVLPANRAMASLKIGAVEAAEKDCTLAIKLDPTYVKAFHRRGMARAASEKYQLARQDFLKVLELDPNNKVTQVELQKIDKIFRTLEEERDALVKQMNQLNENLRDQTNVEIAKDVKPDVISKVLNLNHPGKILPIDKPTNSRSKNPLKRICVLPSDENETLELNATVTKSKEESQPAASRKDKPIIKKSVQNVKSTVQSVERLKPTVPSVPVTAYQFESDWRRLQNHPDLQFEYLKQFPAENIKVLFKQSIETEVFLGIFRVLEQNIQGSESMVIEYLLNLTQVGRFATLILFFSEEEKNVVKKLFQTLDQDSSYDLTKFRKLYLI